MTQLRKVTGVATSIRMEQGKTIVRYHSTDVVTVYPNGNVKLDTGGWRTATTKVRMNQASAQFGLGFRVYADKGEWYVSFPPDWSKEGRIAFDGDTLTLKPRVEVAVA